MLRPSRAFAQGEMLDLCPSIVRPMTDWRKPTWTESSWTSRLEMSEHIVRVSML